MGDLFARLLPVSSSFSPQSHQMATPSSRVFTLRTSSQDRSITLLHPAGYPETTPPIFSVAVHKTSKPNVVVFRGAPQGSPPIGDARFHSFSSTTDVTLRGEPLRLKQSQLSGSFTLEAGRRGTFKWHLDQLTGSSLELRDAAGTVIAVLKSGVMGFGERRLEITVPCDEAFVELVVVSGVVGMVLTRQMFKAGAEGSAEAVAAVVGV